MEQEATQELVDWQGHASLLVAVSGISPAKGDVLVGKSNEPNERIRRLIFTASVITLKPATCDQCKTGHLSRFRLDCFTPQRPMSARWVEECRCV